MIVFYDTLGVYGGSTTLLLRMCKWLHDNKMNAAIMCNSADNTEISQRIRDMGIRIDLVDPYDYRSIAQLLKKYSQQEGLKIVTFIWNHYLDLECIKNLYHLDFENLIYCIHPETFFKGKGVRNPKLKAFVKKLYVPIFRKMSVNNAIIMMDTVDIDVTEKYLGTSFVTEPPIISLPIECKARADCEEIISTGYHSNLIMTASRAEYPFKGYVFGLISDFCSLKKKYPEIKLLIVSGGGDIEQLRNAIAQVDETVRRDIELCGWLEYDVLLKQIEACKVFVGMGTSVLESALRYKPSVVVKYNTYDNIADSFISQKPDCTTTGEECDSKAITLIEAALNMSELAYRDEAKSSFEAVKSVYDIEVGMPKLQNTRTQKRGSILSGFETFWHYIYSRINRIRFRNFVNSYDYNALEYESQQKEQEKDTAEG